MDVSPKATLSLTMMGAFPEIGAEGEHLTAIAIQEKKASAH